MKIIYLYIVVFFSLFHSRLNGQPTDSLINSNTTFKFKKDTLFSDNGLKLFVGQKLMIGNPSGDNGNFRSILSHKAAIVPSVWGQDKRYENAIENHVESKKYKALVKTSLVYGNFITIKKITLSKTGKPHFYMANLSSEAYNYICDIRLALILNELILMP